MLLREKSHNKIYERRVRFNGFKQFETFIEERIHLYSISYIHFL